MRVALDPFRLLLISLGGWLNPQQPDLLDDLPEENRVLHEQRGGKRRRFSDDQRRRLAVRAQRRGRRVLHELAPLVTPETLWAWQRRRIARKYEGSKRRGPGRPHTPNEIPRRVVRLATANRDGGYRRIQGALAHLGHAVARTTIANIWKEHGLEPAPERHRKTPWKEFLPRHRELSGAADFCTIAAWTRRGLTRFWVLFLIDLSSRRVESAGVGQQAHGLWRSPVAGNLRDTTDGFRVGKRYLIPERDPLFTAEFLETLEDMGVQSVKLPAPCPNLKAHAERLVRTLKAACLERLILLGEGTLRKALQEFVAHYHRERNPPGLGNRRILKDQNCRAVSGAIPRRQRRGGMRNYYYRQAA